MSNTLTPIVMSRADAVAKIREMLTGEDAVELRYRIDTFNESQDDGEVAEPFDELDALRDWFGAAECAVVEAEEPEHRRQAKAEVLRLNRVLVAIGCYTPITDEAARAACRDGIGVKMSHFPKIDGKRYDWVDWPK